MIGARVGPVGAAGEASRETGGASGDGGGIAVHEQVHEKGRSRGETCLVTGRVTGP